MSDLIDRQEAIDAVCMEWCNVKHQNCEHPFDVEKDDCYWCDGCETALRTLPDLPSAQPEYTDAEIQKMQDLEQAQIEKAYQLGYEEGRNEAQRWTPVSEDKPEPFQEVLVTLHENGWNGTTYDIVESRAYDGDYKITAWMPLPQPYKENEK